MGMMARISALRILRQSAAARAAARYHVLHRVAMSGVRTPSKKMSQRSSRNPRAGRPGDVPVPGRREPDQATFLCVAEKRKHAKLPPLLRDPSLQAQAEELAYKKRAERVSRTRRHLSVLSVASLATV